MTPTEVKSALEAIIYAADEPATIDQMAAVIGEEKHVVRGALDELVASYASDERGVEIRAVAGGYRVYTKPQHHDLVRRFIKSLRPPLRLTMRALETLAVIAYKQPVTQPEIQEIRGVNCAGVIETLLEKRLITTAGRKQVIGRPILYRTSKEFLMRFGLGDVDELPSLKEFEALAREALGTDNGIAAETETPEGEPQTELTEASAADAGAAAAATEVSTEPAPSPQPALPSESTPEPAAQSSVPSKLDSALGTVFPLAEDAARDDTSPQDASAAPGGGRAAETPAEPADRAAKKAAPGNSD
jgi:segregation and condensation protein B